MTTKTYSLDTGRISSSRIEVLTDLNNGVITVTTQEPHRARNTMVEVEARAVRTDSTWSIYFDTDYFANPIKMCEANDSMSAYMAALGLICSRLWVDDNNPEFWG